MLALGASDTELESSHSAPGRAVPLTGITTPFLSCRPYQYIRNKQAIEQNHYAPNHLSIFLSILHGPSMFAVKAKIYGVLYNQASSIAFDQTSSYWSALKSS